MKITKEYIDDTVVCIIRNITDGIWDTILEDNDKRKNADLMARLMERYYSCDLTETNGSEYEDGRFDAYNDAIEIVKRGGAK